MINKKALIVIDLQRGCKQKTEPHNLDLIINRVNRLASEYRKNGQVVIFIQHDGTNEGQYLPGTEEWSLLDELIVTPSDLIIPKTANDAFYNSTLEHELKSRNIDEIAICGWATDFCVNATVQSAYVKDFNVTVVEDAHTVANRKDIPAEKIIEHFNWLWQNMAPTNGSLNVLPFYEIIT